MDIDMRDLQGCDDIMEAGQAFSTPLMSMLPMKFWLGLLAQNAETDNLGCEFGVRANGEDCFVVTSPLSQFEKIWETLRELEPSFHDLSRHDTLTHFSDPIRKVFLQ